MTTMRDVAAVAGVSAKTVSRVFNADPHVLPATRAHVEAVLQQLGYVPNTLATTFRSGRAAAMGVVVPDIMDPFFSAIAKAVETVAAQHDMAVMISTLGDDPSQEPKILESLLSRQISGLVMAPLTRDQSYLRAWADRVAVVLVDRAPVALNVYYFVEDDHGGARTATEHLLRHGHRRIAFLGDTLELSTTQNRLEGYRAALRAAGRPVDEDLVVLGAGTAAGAEVAVAGLQGLLDPPTAVFSSNARCSMYLVPAMAGQRWAVVAFGDFPLANMLSPALTVIDQDPMSLGTMAAERVVARVHHPERRHRRRNVLPVHLVERESCGRRGLTPLFPQSRRDLPQRHLKLAETTDLLPSHTDNTQTGVG